MPPSTEPILWQFSLSTINAFVWLVLLALALWAGLRMRWGRLVALTAFLTFDLVVFGSFVRLTDSGLGCPDWPGCYGQLLPVQAGAQISQAIVEQGGTHGPVSHSKAWIEMLHRYLASFIGVLILVMLIRAVASRFAAARGTAVHTGFGGQVSWRWPLLLLLVVSAQGLFGKWTVTLKLMPIVVTTHLMGGMSLFALLVWFWIRERQREGDASASLIGAPPRARTAVWLAVATLACQLFLGGWVSTNYAVLACANFPGCGDSPIPGGAWNAAFSLLRALGYNADGSLLQVDALRAIHWAHRLGAVATAAAVLAAAFAVFRTNRALQRQGLLIALALVAQIALGIATVLLAQPIALATAHTMMAALLLASLVVAAARLRKQT